MGRVNVSYQMLYTFLDDRKTLKYWKKVTFNIFGRMVLNSYILYKLNSSNPVSWLVFTVSIVEELSREWLQQRENTNRPNFHNSPGPPR